MLIIMTPSLTPTPTTCSICSMLLLLLLLLLLANWQQFQTTKLEESPLPLIFVGKYYNHNFKKAKSLTRQIQSLRKALRKK